MISRRQFTLAICAYAAAGYIPGNWFAPAQADTNTFVGNDKFEQIVAEAASNKWKELPIGELMGNIARELVGTPYVANTLDKGAKEECSVSLKGLDCVTFFETTLDLARMIKKGGSKPSDLVREVTFTRYRNGKLGDYTTRLHYTSDWLYDNEKKGVIKVLTDLPGMEVFPQKVSFMSMHPESYAQLNRNPAFVKAMKTIEEKMNARPLMFVPIDRVASVEPLMKTGDIVGLCTDIPGLDITHTGLILKDAQGVAHFTDASSKKSSMKVTIEPGPISTAISANKHNIGIMLARPLEPQ